MALLSLETYMSVLILRAYYHGDRGIRPSPFIRQYLLGYIGKIVGHKGVDMNMDLAEEMEVQVDKDGKVTGWSSKGWY